MNVWLTCMYRLVAGGTEPAVVKNGNCFCARPEFGADRPKGAQGRCSYIADSDLSLWFNHGKNFSASSLGGNSDSEDLGKVKLYNPFGLIRAYVVCMLCSFRQS